MSDRIGEQEGTYRFLGVLKEDFGAICDTQVLLTLSSSTVDTRGSFGRISTHETEGGFKVC